jgi:hypothetical protein
MRLAEKGEDMNSFEVSVVIDRPMGRVWEFLNTTENELLWQSSAVERVLLTDGPLGKGSRVRQVDRFLGRRLDTEWEVLQLEDYQRRDRTVSGPLEFEVVWRLDPVGEDTRFTMTLTAASGLGGLFGKLADGVVTRMGRREFDANLGKLKDLLEADAAEG